MKSKFILGGLVLVFVFTFGASLASAQSDLSGKWVLDQSRSTDIAPWTGISMTITQKGTKVAVLQKFALSTGEESRNDTFVLNGSTQGVMLDGPNKSRAKGKRTSRKIDGGFESVDEGTFTAPGMSRAVTVKTSRKWQLSSDGKTLTLDITRASELGTRESHRVFTRA